MVWLYYLPSFVTLVYFVRRREVQLFERKGGFVVQARICIAIPTKS